MGAFEGFSYSQDIKDGAAAGKVWDEATLDNYITNPKVLAPKGKMAFAGIKNDEAQGYIAFLAQFNADGSKDRVGATGSGRRPEGPTGARPRCIGPGGAGRPPALRRAVAGRGVSARDEAAPEGDGPVRALRRPAGA